jgi:hypothetical protein
VRVGERRVTRIIVNQTGGRPTILPLSGIANEHKWAGPAARAAGPQIMAIRRRTGASGANLVLERLLGADRIRVYIIVN